MHFRYRRVIEGLHFSHLESVRHTQYIIAISHLHLIRRALWVKIDFLEKGNAYNYFGVNHWRKLSFLKQKRNLQDSWQRSDPKHLKIGWIVKTLLKQLTQSLTNFFGIIFWSLPELLLEIIKQCILLQSEWRERFHYCCKSVGYTCSLRVYFQIRAVRGIM